MPIFHMTNTVQAVPHTGTTQPRIVQYAAYNMQRNIN